MEDLDGLGRDESFPLLRGVAPKPVPRYDLSDQVADSVRRLAGQSTAGDTLVELIEYVHNIAGVGIYRERRIDKLATTDRQLVLGYAVASGIEIWLLCRGKDVCLN